MENSTDDPSLNLYLDETTWYGLFTKFPHERNWFLYFPMFPIKLLDKLFVKFVFGFIYNSSDG